MPLLLVLVFGIVDFGRMFSAQEQLTEAARAAAQAQLVGGNAAQAAQDVFTEGRVSAVVPVATCGRNPAANAVSQVRLEYRFTFVTPIAVFAGLTGSPTLTATGTVPCRG